MIRFFLIFCLAWFASSVEAQPQPPTNPNAGNSVNLSIAGLHVVGNQILNNLNQAVQLRGVDISGSEYMCLGTANTTFDPASGAPNNIALLQSWAINIVRLPLNEDCWLNINGVSTGGSTYINAITSYVNALNAANIAVIADLQWAAPGTTQSTGSWCNGQFAPAPDNDHAPAFWSSVASTFAGNASVIFDLYNEPWVGGYASNSTLAALLLNGGTVTDCAAPYTSVGWQSLVNTIRGTGAHNIIDVPGLGVTNEIDQWLNYKPTDTLNPPQLAAAWHSYAGQTCSALSCYNSTVLPIMQSVPLVTEEIGESDCADIYVNPLMTWLDANGGNYLAWAWDTYSCGGFPAVIADNNGTPTSFGLGIRNHYLVMSGQSVPAPPIVPFFATTFPVGLWIGGNSNYVGSGAVTYYGDINNASNPGLQVQVTNNPPNYSFAFAAFTTADTITGTPDPTLYKTGREGCCGKWVINVPNGSYVVTLGGAPNSTYTTGTYGQDVYMQGQVVANCVWSFTPATCPGSGTAPTIDVALTASYNVTVYNQQISVEVAASNGGANTTLLNTIKIAQNAPLTVPTAPTGVTATPGNVVVNLSWSASATATYYIVLRATNTNGAYLPVGISNGTSYTDSAVVNNTTYYYYIQAANGVGPSANSLQVSATPPGVVAPPGIPSGLTAQPGNTQIVLNWTVGSNATSTNILRSTTTGGPYTLITNTAAASYTDVGLTNGTTYYYVLEGVNSSGTSANSSQVSATPIAASSGVWYSVTPGNVNYNNVGGCGNYGTQTVGADTANPGTLYAEFNCQGIWKSTDYGQTWSGPVNTGTNGAGPVANCQGGMTVDPNPGILRRSMRSVFRAQATVASGNQSMVELIGRLLLYRPIQAPMAKMPISHK